MTHVIHDIDEILFLLDKRAYHLMSFYGDLFRALSSPGQVNGWMPNIGK